MLGAPSVNRVLASSGGLGTQRGVAHNVRLAVSANPELYRARGSAVLSIHMDEQKLTRIILVYERNGTAVAGLHIQLGYSLGDGDHLKFFVCVRPGHSADILPSARLFRQLGLNPRLDRRW